MQAVEYSIKEFSDLTGLPSPTLRYYESEGALPFVRRDANGNRRYDQTNLQWVDFILALRSTGMTIPNIKRYVELYQHGPETLAERKAMLVAHRARVEAQMRSMANSLAKIDYKLGLYRQLEADPKRTDIVI